MRRCHYTITHSHLLLHCIHYSSIRTWLCTTTPTGVAQGHSESFGVHAKDAQHGLVAVSSYCTGGDAAKAVHRR